MREKIIKIIEKHAARPVHEHSTFEALEMDSLEFLDTLAEIEGELGVPQTPDAAIAKMKTVADVADYFMGKLACA
jgi:acyl carrier protein